MPQEIDSVVLDLGGVVIDLDRSRCIEAFHRLGYKVERDLDLYVQRGTFYELECGHITAAEFYDRMRELCPRARCDKDIQQAFNAFLVDLPVARLDAIAALRRRYKVFALSNTNPVMYNSWIATAFGRQGLAIDDYFQGVAASFREGCCKPDPKIFQILLRRYDLEPSRTLYLDDSADNCRAAAGCGMQTAHVTAECDMLQISASLLADE